MSPLTRGRAAAVCLAYLLLHVGFDAAARIFQVTSGVSLWYPPVGLAMALIVIFGVRWAPAVLAANIYSGFINSTGPLTWPQLVLPLWITAIYVGTGALVRHWFGPIPSPTKPARVAGLVALVLAAPFGAGLVGTAVVIFGHHVDPARFSSIAFGWCIGDLTGVLTTVPLCLVHLAPRLLLPSPARSHTTPRERLEIAAQIAALLGALGLVHALGYLQAYRSYYLCFIPLVWICLRHGLRGATLAIFALTLGSLASMQAAGASNEVVADLLLFQVAGTAVGLGLGATVTRRTGAENERTRLLAILEATPDFIGTIDLDGRILYQNAAFLRLRGFASLDQARSRPLVENLPAWAAEKFSRDGIPAALERGVWQGELALLDTTGREIPVAQTLVAHYDAEQRPVMLSTVARDITLERAGERARLESERNLLQSQKLESLGVLAGGIAHDFNNLLTVVLGNATLARLDTPADSSAEKAIHQIELAALRAAELCRQMLAYSGRGQLGTENIDLTKIVEETINLLKVSISKKCVLEFALTPGLPPVRGDATQLNQIAMNLVMNASDACGEKGGRIAVRTGLMHVDRAFLAGTYLSPSLEPGPFVFLEVSDEGVGMTPEVLARIFEPFFTTKFSGHGLGLSAVLGIARSHRGAIKVESTPGTGTRFRLLLPAAAGVPTPGAAIAQAAAGWRGSGRVLVVDDEESVREIAAKILERHGLTVVPAADGREGVDLLAREPAAFCAVLLDLTMPVMDGEQALREIRRRGSRVPVLLMSGYSRTDSATRFAGLQLDGFVQKPFETARLVEAVRTVLQNR